MGKRRESTMPASRQQARHRPLLTNASKTKGFGTPPLPVETQLPMEVLTMDIDAVLLSRLQVLYKFVSEQSPIHNSAPLTEFATLYKLTTSGSIETFPLWTLPQLMQASKLAGNNILFLRGQPCPEWLAYVGATYRIDPSFFFRHLDFLTNRWRMQYYAQPAIPSTQYYMAQFTYVTLGRFPATAGIGDHTSLNQRRSNAEKGMTEYLTALWGQVSKGASIIRELHVLNEKHFAIEQQVSICFQQTEEKNWTVVVWLDSGKPLTADLPRPWKKDLHGDQHTHYETFLPWIQAREEVPMPADNGLELPALLPHLNYGQTLDKAAMAQDPFYSLHELLMSCARSESQFLTLVESKILAMTDDDLSLTEITYITKVLNKHAESLRCNVAFLESRNKAGWSQPADPRIAEYTRTQAQVLLQDFRYLLKRVEERLDYCGCLLSVIDSKNTMRQVSTVTRDNMLAFMFLSLSFISAIYGMAFSLFVLGPMRNFWLLSTGVAFVLFFLSALFWSIDDRTWMFIKTKLSMLWLPEEFATKMAHAKTRPSQGKPVLAPKHPKSSKSPRNKRPGEDSSHSPKDHTVLQPGTAGLLAVYDVPQHKTSLSDLPEEASSNSTHLSHETSDGTETFSDDSEVDSIGDLTTQKAQIVDHLMVHVYDMFALPDVKKCKGGSGSSSSTSIIQGNEKTTQELPSYGSKRTLYSRGERNDDEDRDEEDDDDTSKRRKMAKPVTDDFSKDSKRLACPYYKQDPHAHKSSKACAGPGWYKVHRLKEHLYREHAEPLHCRRCYAVFRNEEQLTEHSRSHEQCTVRDAQPIIGFNKDQEAKLKCRSTMFRADSEEHKWKIIFLILFPDTALSEVPSPYYDLDLEDALGQPERGSPKPPEIQQFDAYMKRELPRIIRKALEAKIENLFGPIQETLKNDLENIVRDCQEDLTRNYMNTMQPSNTLLWNRKHSAKHQQQTPQGAIIDSQSPGMALPNLDQLAKYFVPPDAPSDPWLGVTQPSSSGHMQDSFSDSANYSLSTNAQNQFWDDLWLNSMSSNNMGDILSASEPRDVQTNTMSYDNEPMFQPPETYTGKGKGRARDSGLDSDVEMDRT